MKTSVSFNITAVFILAFAGTFAEHDMYHIIIKCGRYSEIQLENFITELQGTYDVSIEEPRSKWIHFITVRLNEESLEYVRSLPYVDTVEPVMPVTYNCLTQNHADWGLRRISGDKHAANSFTYKHNGSDVTIYIVDTGVNLNHDEFEDRAQLGTCVHKSVNPAADVSNHGTAVAALAIGTISGAAKNARAVSVRVANDTGHINTSSLATGLEWVKNDHIKRANEKNITEKQLCSQLRQMQHKAPKSIVNLSLGVEGTSPLIKRHIARLFECGITVVTSAGNNNTDACNISPANAKQAITVACTDSGDNLCESSNYGECVTILAPGHNVKSASSLSNNDFKSFYGNSFSAPLVAGVAAQFVSSLTYTPTPQEVNEWLIRQATKNDDTLRNRADKSPKCLVHSDCKEKCLNQTTLTCPRASATIDPGETFQTLILAITIPLSLVIFILLVLLFIVIFRYNLNTRRIPYNQEEEMEM